MQVRAIVGYSSPDPLAIVEDVTVIAEVNTGGHDGDGKTGTELLSVVINQYNNFALCRRSTEPFTRLEAMPVTYVTGATNQAKLAAILRQLANQLEGTVNEIN